jgi:hypothetical protein
MTITETPIHPRNIENAGGLQEELVRRMKAVPGISRVEADGSVIRVYVPSLFDPVAKHVAAVEIQFCQEFPAAHLSLEIEGLRQLGECAKDVQQAA